MSFISPVRTDASGNPRQTGSMQTLGKDDFLQLLVTKLRYQDPLQPMEDEDFVAQLAQFSTLEQMSNIAEGIELSNQWDFLQMQAMNNVMAAGFIGRDIRAEFTGVYVDANNTPRIAFTADQYADEIKFEIRDIEGTLVRTLTLDDVEPGPGNLQWDGKDERGNRVEEGYYTVTAEAATQSGNSFSPSLSLVGTVSQVTYRDGVAYLIVDGTQVALGDVTAVGEPGSFSDEE
jgi:flagellar basal-body rod modification protein FlgD